MEEFNGQSLTEYQDHAKKTIEMIVKEYQQFPIRNVFNKDIKVGFLRSALSKEAPEEPEHFSKLLSDTQNQIIPNMTQWQHSKFFAYFPANIHHSSILAEMVASSFNAPAFTWYASPASTELENHMADWLCRAFHLPEKFLLSNQGGGCIYNTVGESIMLAVHTAKHNVKKAMNFDNTHPNNLKFVGYFSSMCHISTKKAMHLKDVPHIRDIPAEFDPDQNKYIVKPEKLEEMIKEDKAKGLIPFFVGTTIGSTSTGGSDDVEAIGKICQKHNLWFNVDCAWAGAAFICEENVKPYIDGLKYANSMEINLAKWFLCGMNCVITFIDDKQRWVEAISGKGSAELEAEYLKNKYTDSGAVVDYKDWHISLGKRFSGLRVWYTLRTVGLKNYRKMIRNDCELAAVCEEKIKKHKRIDLLCQRELALVCFRLVRDRSGKPYHVQELNAINKHFCDKINESGEFHLTGSVMNDVYFGRICICNASTTVKEVDDLFEHMDLCLDQIDGEYQEKLEIEKKNSPKPRL